MARDDSRDVDRKRAATGLVRALARPQRSCLVWACPAQLLRGWLGRCGAGANHGAGQGARDEHARQRSGARPRVVQTDTLHAPEACDSSEAAWERSRSCCSRCLEPCMTLLLRLSVESTFMLPTHSAFFFLVVYLEPGAAEHVRTCSVRRSTRMPTRSHTWPVLKSRPATRRRRIRLPVVALPPNWRLACCCVCRRAFSNGSACYVDLSLIHI